MTMMQVKNKYREVIYEYSELDNYISESCFYCGEELTNIKDIYLDEDDHYLCKNCGDNYNIHTKKCRELSF